MLATYTLFLSRDPHNTHSNKFVEVKSDQKFQMPLHPEKLEKTNVGTRYHVYLSLTLLYYFGKAVSKWVPPPHLFSPFGWPCIQFLS